MIARCQPGWQSVAWLAAVLCLGGGCTLSFDSPPQVRQVALADLDGDGAVDAFVANGRYGEPYTYPPEITFQALFNDGAGRFASRGGLILRQNSTTVALGDVNQDGAVDVLLGGAGERVLLNDGTGRFPRQHTLPYPGDVAAFRSHLALADLNGDGRLDVFAAFCCGGVASRSATDRWLLFSPNLVWLNEGGGVFRSTGQRLGAAGSNGVALGDLNGDGFPDAFVANGQTNMTLDGRPQFNTPNRVWLNDGRGQFTDSGQLLGRADSRAVALGDVNGDGYLDAVVGNDGPDEVWGNDGGGDFHHDGQLLGDELTRAVFLADMDGDGDLDYFAAGQDAGRLWLNDGAGGFTPDRQRLPYDEAEALALGDLNGDGAADVLVVGINTHRVWLNDGRGRLRPP